MLKAEFSDITQQQQHCFNIKSVSVAKYLVDYIFTIDLFLKRQPRLDKKILCIKIFLFILDKRLILFATDQNIHCSQKT